MSTLPTPVQWAGRRIPTCETICRDRAGFPLVNVEDFKFVEDDQVDCLAQLLEKFV